MKRDMNLIRELLRTLEAAATDRGFSFEEGEAETLKCTLDQIRYNLQQAEEMGLIVVGSKPLNGEWIILRLTPRGHDFLESGQNTQRLLRNALKEPECITLAEGLALLECHLPTEQAKLRLRQAFIRRALIQSESPLFALPYDEAEIDWATGSVKIPGKKDRFCPTFLRADFKAYFFEDHIAAPGATFACGSPPPSYARQTVISAADMLKALGHNGFDRFLLELDLPDQSVGKGNGLMARATSLAEYAIRNPEQLTPERRTVVYEIIRRATQLWHEEVTSNLGAGERERFASAMRREGKPLALSPEQINLALWRPEEGNSGVVPSISLTGLAPDKLADAGISSPTPLKDSTTVEASSPPQPKEMLTLKPTFMGMSLDLKELYRRAKEWWKHNK